MHGLGHGHRQGLGHGHWHGLDHGHMHGLDHGHRHGLGHGHRHGLDHGCTVILTFYTAANVHSVAKQLLRIIHTSLAHRKSFHEKPSERYHPAKVFMLGRTGTYELQMGR